MAGNRPLRDQRQCLDARRTLSSDLHLDGVVMSPMVYLDDEVVLRDGKLQRETIENLVSDRR